MEELAAIPNAQRAKREHGAAVREREREREFLCGREGERESESDCGRERTREIGESACVRVSGRVR